MRTRNAIAVVVAAVVLGGAGLCHMIEPRRTVVERVLSPSGRFEAVHDQYIGSNAVEFLTVVQRHEEPRGWFSVSLMHGSGPWLLAWEGDSVLHMSFPDGVVTFGDTLVKVGKDGVWVHVEARRRVRGWSEMRR